MLITFFANYLNNHILPLCNSLYHMPGIEFYFVAMGPTDKERMQMGFDDFNASYPYCIRPYEDEAAYRRGMQLGLESDVVIIGSPPLSSDSFVEERLRQKKLTYRHSERLFKHPRWMYMAYPRYRRAIMNKHIRYKDDKQYLLCASAYAKEDFIRLGAYQNKALKWGYFPDSVTYNIEDILKQKNKNLILWCGRMIDLKHPEHAVYVAKRLKERNIQFQMVIIGDGDRRPHIEALVDRYDLRGMVLLTGFLKSDAVREYMEAASIVLFTSNKREGWGAVLNEAMSACCATIVSGQVGAAKYLIDGSNGLIYDTKEQLYENTERLLNNKEACQEMGRRAYMTVADMWNAHVAAERLVEISRELITGGDVPNLYTEGPCSLA